MSRGDRLGFVVGDVRVRIALIEPLVLLRRVLVVLRQAQVAHHPNLVERDDLRWVIFCKRFFLLQDEV